MITIDKHSVFGRPSKRPQKPNASIQRQVEAACEKLITELKTGLIPLPEPLEWNHVTDIYGKWFRHQYCIYKVYHCPPDSLMETFDSGLARLGWTGGDTYLLSYFRHTEKWELLFEDLPLEECVKRILESDFFEF